MVAEETKRHGRLPEQTRYADTGCEVAPRCLECPLAKCKYDGGLVELKIMQQKKKESEIVRLFKRGRLTAKQLARRFGLTERSIYRILSSRAN